MSLLIRKDGEGSWHPPDVNQYENEAGLQAIIVGSPSLLPGVADTGVLALEEMEVAGPGFIDVFCLDLDGALTICECKLRTNSEIRRKIVGQLMAYASALWKVPYDELERSLDTRIPEGLTARMGQLASEAERPGWSATEFSGRSTCKPGGRSFPSRVCSRRDHGRARAHR
jgi:hypothetical protein